MFVTCIVTCLTYGSSLLAVTIANNNLVPRISHLTAPWDERGGGGKMRDHGNEVELITLPWHAPAKIKRGGHFCVLTGIWVFQTTTCTGQLTLHSHATKLGLRSTSQRSDGRPGAEQLHKNFYNRNLPFISSRQTPSEGRFTLHWTGQPATEY